MILTLIILVVVELDKFDFMINNCMINLNYLNANSVKNL